MAQRGALNSNLLRRFAVALLASSPVATVWAAEPAPALTPVPAVAAPAAPAAAPAPAQVEAVRTVDGLVFPESVALGKDGRIYVSTIGDPAVDGDGQIVVIDEKTGQAAPFAKGLNNPKGLVAVGENLFVTDVNRVCKIDPKGELTVFVANEAFQPAPLFLNDIDADASGNLYVSDSGDRKGKEGKVYRITADGQPSLLVDGNKEPNVTFPNGVLLTPNNTLLIADMAPGDLFELNLETKQLTKVNAGFPGADGLAFDAHGRLLVSVKEGKVFLLQDKAAPGRLLSDKFVHAADLVVHGKQILVPDLKGGKLVWLPLPEPAAVAAPAPK